MDSPDTQTRTASLLLGGAQYTLLPMNLRTLKVAWPILSRLNRLTEEQQKLSDSLASDPDSGEKLMAAHANRMDLIAQVMVACLQQADPGMNLDKFEQLMVYDETVLMLQTFTDLLVISGLDKSGEAQPSAEAAVSQDSTATGTGSLQS